MTRDQITAAAERAANIAGCYTKREGGFLGAIGSYATAAQAAEFVLGRGGDLTAEDLYWRFNGEPAAGWMDIEPRKRVAIEVFRACVIVLSKPERVNGDVSLLSKQEGGKA